MMSKLDLQFDLRKYPSGAARYYVSGSLTPKTVVNVESEIFWPDDPKLLGALRAYNRWPLTFTKHLRRRKDATDPDWGFRKLTFAQERKVLDALLDQFKKDFETD